MGDVKFVGDFVISPPRPMQEALEYCAKQWIKIIGKELEPICSDSHSLLRPGWEDLFRKRFVGDKRSDTIPVSQLHTTVDLFHPLYSGMDSFLDLNMYRPSEYVLKDKREDTKEERLKKIDPRLIAWVEDTGNTVVYQGPLVERWDPLELHCGWPAPKKGERVFFFRDIEADVIYHVRDMEGLSEIATGDKTISVDFVEEGMIQSFDPQDKNATSRGAIIRVREENDNEGLRSRKEFHEGFKKGRKW